MFKRAVRDAVLCTHVHPEGVEGALAQAAAVAALSLSTPTSEQFCQHVDEAGIAYALREVCARKSRRDCRASSNT